MKELFTVDPTTLIVLIGLFVFVVFVVIYKSKQQSTTYYSNDDVYDDEVEEIEKVDSQEDLDSKKVWFYVDLTSIFVFSLIMYVLIVKRLYLMDFFLGNFGISFVGTTVLYYLVIKPSLFNTK